MQLSGRGVDFFIAWTVDICKGTWGHSGILPRSLATAHPKADGSKPYSVTSRSIRSIFAIAPALIWHTRAALTSRVSPISCRFNSSKK